MDSIVVLVIALIWFGFWAYLDGEESLKTKTLGGHEWNPLMRDGQRKFTPIRYTVANVVFIALSIVAYNQHWGMGSDPSIATNWQPAATLFLVGAGHIFGFFTNQSKVRQLEWRVANPALPGEIRLPL